MTAASKKSRSQVKEMKPSLVFMPTAIVLVMGAALLAQPPAGAHNPGHRLENMLTRILSLNATQQGQVHTILADAQVQSQGIRDQLKPLRTSLIAAIKANGGTIEPWEGKESVHYDPVRDAKKWGLD